MMRVISIIAALAAPFMFPAPLMVFLAAVAAFFSPFIAVSVGILVDLLYRAPGEFPYGLIVGALGTVVALLVRRFVETRIIGG